MINFLEVYNHEGGYSSIFKDIDAATIAHQFMEISFPIVIWCTCSPKQDPLNCMS